MNAQNTSSAPKTQTRRTGSPGAGGQWWKAWVLLTGLGATTFGWMAFQQAEPVLRVEPIGSPRNLPTSARRLPTMPQKPVFQAPVTRTRRS